MIHERYIKAAEIHPVLARLTSVRLAWGLSTKEVAQRIGCSEFTLIHMEGGQKQPGFKIFTRWADVLGFDLNLWPKDELCTHRVPEPTAGALVSERT